MQIKSVIIENFRGYRSRQQIPFGNFTAFVGKNDVGKSTILEALDIFFNEGSGSIAWDSKDVNIEASNSAGNTSVDVVIGVEFDSLPTSLVLDENNSTTLADEYLLSNSGTLIIMKHYTSTGKSKVYIYANHPSNVECRDLLSKKQSELRKLTVDLSCDKNKNAEMRKALREQHRFELNLEMTEIDVSKEDAKNIWEKIKIYLPVYSLFQADRSNEDKDKEVQDPLKAAIKIILSRDCIKEKCKEIYSAVMQELDEVSKRTMDKLSEMNSSLASSLNPTLPSYDTLKWSDVFKGVSISGDNDIPINKRGSGVKRMILLNFFRAEAERNQQSLRSPGIIYAIEEPETAQHIEHQKLLIESLRNLSNVPNTQVIITTHSSNILKRLSFDMIRLVTDTNSGKIVKNIESSQLPYPSLNEIAFTHFGDVSAEYHNELYGYIELEEWLKEFKEGKPTFTYKQLCQNGNIKDRQLTKTEIIRHQIHHPENDKNNHYTEDELRESIKLMRDFILRKSLSIHNI